MMKKIKNDIFNTIYLYSSAVCDDECALKMYCSIQDDYKSFHAVSRHLNLKLRSDRA